MSSSTSTSERFFVLLALACALGAVLGGFSTAFGRADTWPQLGFATAGRADVALFGNSVNRTRSHCDRDLRDLASMLSDALGRPVRDVSSGGMQAAEHLALARLLVRRRAVRSIVLQAPPGALEEGDLGDARARGRVATYSLLAGAAFDELHGLLVPSSAPLPRSRSPRDAELARERQARMQAEKNAERCPELVAQDREFLSFMYRDAISALPERVEVPRSLAALADEANAAGVELLVYVAPFPLELLEREGLAAERARFERYTESLRDALARSGVRTLDLHDLLPSEAFTDLWCACGHLAEGGRRRLSERLAEELGRAPR